MLLFDDGKKLEKAVGEEAAKAIVEVLERFDESQRNAQCHQGRSARNGTAVAKRNSGIGPENASGDRKNSC